MPYRMINVFCGASPSLEEERLAFYRVVGECNENHAMRRGLLYIPLSVAPTVSDRTRIQHSIDFNIRLTHIFIQVLDTGWAAAPEKFEHELRLALACLENPEFPMSDVAILLKQGADDVREFLKSGRAQVLTYSGIGDFQSQIAALLLRSLDTAAVELPPAAPQDDAAFVRQLVMETVAEELGAGSWPEELRGPLLDIQYQARMKGLSENFPDASQEILRVNGEPVGWMVVARREDEIRLVDIAIAQSHRGKGIGRAKIAELLAEADRVGKVVRLSVGVMNPAVRLYDRLGFRRTGGDVLRYLMERLPDHSGE